MQAISSEQKKRSNLYLVEDLKNSAKDIYKRYGLTLSDAVNIFLAQTVMEKGLPFELRIPNDETMKAMEEVRAGVNVEDISIEEILEAAKGPEGKGAGAKSA